MPVRRTLEKSASRTLPFIAFYLSTVFDKFSRYIIAWKLCTTVKADDVTASNLAGDRVMWLRRTINCASTLGVSGWETVIAPNADL